MHHHERRREGPSPAPGRPSPTPVSAFAGFGLQFVLAVILFLYAGEWVDRKLGTSPLFLIIGVFVGAGGSFYSIVRSVGAHRRDDHR